MSVDRYLTEAELDAFARRALLGLVRERGAVIFAEATTTLGESDWLRREVPDFPYPRMDPHVVRRARRTLLGTGELVQDGATLGSGRTIHALVPGTALRERGRRSATLRTAGAKRRLYDTYLSWTHRPNLCGQVAERVVLASMRSATGFIGVPTRPGNVREIEGQRLGGDKTLDAAAHVIGDPRRPTRADGPSLIPTGVEVKNVRQALYPQSSEVWDLLVKLSAFPDVVPLLVCRLTHATIFNMAADIGMMAFFFRRQMFADSIDVDRFKEVTQGLHFTDARRVADPDRSLPMLTGFFTKNVRASAEDDARPLIVRSLERWAIAAPIVEAYADLAEGLDEEQDRQSLFRDFRQDIDDAGLRTRGGW